MLAGNLSVVRFLSILLWPAHPNLTPTFRVASLQAVVNHKGSRSVVSIKDSEIRSPQTCAGFMHKLEDSSAPEVRRLGQALLQMKRMEPSYAVLHMLQASLPM